VATTQRTVRAANVTASVVKPEQKSAAEAASIAPASAAPSTEPGPSRAENASVHVQQVPAAAQPMVHNTPKSASATAAPSAASTQTGSTPAKPSSTSPSELPAAATQISVPAAAAAAVDALPVQDSWPKFGSTDFATAPIVSVRAPNGMLKGRLGNPSVCAHADGTLASVSGSMLPPADAVHYIFTLDGIAGKFAGPGASREVCEACYISEQHV
jgi:hypothetical protein